MQYRILAASFAAAASPWGLPRAAARPARAPGRVARRRRSGTPMPALRSPMATSPTSSTSASTTTVRPRLRLGTQVGRRQLLRDGDGPGGDRSVRQPGAVHAGHRSQAGGLVDTLNTAPASRCSRPTTPLSRRSRRRPSSRCWPPRPSGPRSSRTTSCRAGSPRTSSPRARPQDAGGLDRHPGDDGQQTSPSTAPRWSAATCRPPTPPCTSSAAC